MPRSVSSLPHIGTDIAHAADLLRRDEVVAVPTETVYGLAANAFSERAVTRVFEVKNRPKHNPLIVHLAHADRLAAVVREVPDVAWRLLEIFSPGPLTLLLPKQPTISDVVTAGLPQVAVRIPAHPLTQELLHALEFPLAAPSANPFGYISPTSAQHVARQLGQRVPYILDGGPCAKGIESTVVGFDGERPVLYRLGAISREQLMEALDQDVPVRNHEEVRPMGPGMLAHHYAPNTRLVLTDAPGREAAFFPPQEVGVLVFRNPVEGVPEHQQFVLSPEGNVDEAARNLYHALHYLDALNLCVLVAELMPAEGIGLAINDRLRRAALPRTKP